MNFVCIGSGSSGNCYMLAGDAGVLVIEAGLPFASVKRALDFDITKIAGVAVTHEHNDHAGHLGECLKAGLKVVAPAAVIAKQGKLYRHQCTEARPQEWAHLGGFSLYPLPVKHDVPCIAYVICHKDIGRALFVTDTMSFPYQIAGLDHIMIEADYDDDTLLDAIDNGVTCRVMLPRLLRTHLELGQTVQIIRRLSHAGLREAVLIHLSHNNADAGRFRAAVERETGVPTYVAESGLTLDFSV